MTLNIHGNPATSCTRRVILIAKERNIPYEFIPVDFTTREHKQPAHLEHQPFGQVPYLTVRRLSLHITPRIMTRNVVVHALSR